MKINGFFIQPGIAKRIFKKSYLENELENSSPGACPKLKGLSRDCLHKLKDRLKYKPFFHITKAQQKEIILCSFPVIAQGLDINLVNEIQSADHRHR